MHQFLHRGTPKVLPEQARLDLARLLQVPEDTLRGAHPRRTRTAPPKQAAALLASVSIPPAARDIPVYSEDDPMTPEGIGTWVRRPPQLQAASRCFAIWITRPHGRRMSTGDIAYVHEAQPPRPGDSVVVVRAGRMTAIGDLVHTTGNQATIQCAPPGGTAEAIDLTDARMMRIVLLDLS